MNPMRGDTTVVLNGEAHILRLTLGGLAEIENALQVSDLAALTERLANTSANDLLKILQILLKASGSTLSVDELKQTDLHLKSLIRAVSNAFNLALVDAAEETEPAPGKQERLARETKITC